MASSEQVNLILKVVDKSSKELTNINNKIALLDKQVGRTDEGINKFDNSTKSLTKSVAGLAVAYVGLTEAIGQGRAILDVSLQLDAINQRLIFVTGSAQGAAAEFDFISKEADRLNQNILVLGQGFSKFSAGAKSILEINEIKESFLGVVEAGTALKLTSDQINGALLALTQIASKGKVQAEELRGQIGERLPGAFSIAARAMNVTEQELNKMLETGQVLSKDFLPAFGKELRKTFGDDATRAAESGIGKINEYNNAIIGLRTTIGTLFSEPASAVTEFFTSFATGFDIGLQQVNLRVEKLSLAFQKLGPELALAFAESARQSLFEDLADAIGATTENIQELKDEMAFLNAQSAIADEKYQKLQQTWDSSGKSAEAFGQSLLPIAETFADFTFDTTPLNDFNKHIQLISDKLDKTKRDFEFFQKTPFTLIVETNFELANPKQAEKQFQDAINKFKLQVKEIEVDKAGKEIATTINALVTDSLANGIADALEGDFDAEGLVKSLGRSLLVYGLQLELTTETAVSLGVSKGLAGAGVGAGLILGASALGGSGLFGGGSKSKPKISLDEQADRKFQSLIDAITNNTDAQIASARGQEGQEAVRTSEDIANLIASQSQELAKSVGLGDFSDVNTFEQLKTYLQGVGIDLATGEQGTRGEQASFLAIEKLSTELSESLNENIDSLASFVNEADKAEIAQNTLNKAISKSTVLQESNINTTDDFIKALAASAKKQEENNQLIALGLDIEEPLSELDNAILSIAGSAEDAIAALQGIDDGLGSFADSVLSLGNITQQQQSFIDKNLGTIETGSQSVARLTERFEEEALQAENLRKTIGEDATATQLAQLAKEEQDVLNIAQPLIDQIRETRGSTAQGDAEIAEVIGVVEENRNQLLLSQENILLQHTDILTDVRDAIFEQNEILKGTQVAI
jgi:tape measure domain-containing protein